jgi:hypothetical protein
MQSQTPLAVWVIFPNLDLFTDFTKKYRGSLQFVSEKQCVTWTTPSYILYLTCPANDSTISLTNHLFQRISTFPTLNYIFLLGHGTAPSYPVDIGQGFCSSERRINVGEVFFCEQAFNLPDETSDYDSQGMMNCRMKQRFTSDNDRIPSAPGFSHSGVITEALFKRAQQISYRTAFANKSIATFYYSLYEMNITNLVVALISIDSIVGETISTEDAEKSTDNLFTTFLKMLECSHLRLFNDQINTRIDPRLMPRPQSNSNEGNTIDLEIQKATIISIEKYLEKYESEKKAVEEQHVSVIKDILTNRNTAAGPATIEDQFLCKMCYVNHIDTVVLPCKHAVICSSCSDKFAANPALPSAKNCVFCQTAISQVIRIKME